MKRIVLVLLISPLIIAIGYFGLRYSKNKASVTPYPFSIPKTAQSSIDAPILIIGDQLAVRLNKFKDLLATEISANLTKNIKIESLAQENLSAARIKQIIFSLEKLPLIIIYLGNNSEQYERLFKSKDIPTINKNFKVFEDDIIQSLIQVFPNLSKLVYSPVNYVQLQAQVTEDTNDYSDSIYQMRSAVHFKIYNNLMKDILKYTKKNNSVFIPITTPINFLDSNPKSCYGSIDDQSSNERQEIQTLLKRKDFKNAYQKSKDIVVMNPYHAPSLLLHAKISQGINKIQEAQKYYALSSVYYCKNPRTNPIYNNILKENAKDFGLTYIDFYQLILDQSFIDNTFLDQIHPQDIYYKKLVSILAIKIKTLLKL